MYACHVFDAYLFAGYNCFKSSIKLLVDDTECREDSFKAEVKTCLENFYLIALRISISVQIGTSLLKEYKPLSLVATPNITISEPIF